jgi:hypothetical protein
MEAPSAKEVYEQHVKRLPPEERKRLAEMITEEMEQPATQKERSIMELHGLGAEIWEGTDAQEYVNELRKEWDHRP